MTLYVSVRRAIINANVKNKQNEAPYEIRTSKTDPNPTRVHAMELTGIVRLMYDPQNPLVSGAHCWLEIDELPGG